jgi:hypothetical protein
MSAAPKAVVTCTLQIRLDGKEPGVEHELSAEDYSPRWRDWWLRFEAWMRAEGITPLFWPSALDWWHVSFTSPFRLDEIDRVILYLHEQGVEVENVSGDGGASYG